MGKNDLMPCPHCGGAITIIDDNRYCSYGELPSIFWVVCKMCGARGGTGKNSKEAVKQWNRRAPLGTIIKNFVRLIGHNRHKST